MPDIFLRPGEASPSDIKLRDPTLPDTAGVAWSTTDVQQDVSLARVDYDPTEQAWAVAPPQNVAAQAAWSEAQPDPPPTPTYDPSEQAWAVGPPLNAVTLSGWTVEGHLPDQTQRAYDGQDGALAPQPPAAAGFDPAAGFPWPIDIAYPDQTVRWWSPEQASNVALSGDCAFQSGTFQPGGFQVCFEPALGFPWQTDQPLVDQTVRAFDPNDPWFVGPPSVAAAFDPAAGFPWNGDQPLPDQTQRAYAPEDAPAIGAPTTEALAPLWNQGDDAIDRAIRATDTNDQAWAVGPPANAAALSAWTVEDHLPDQAQRTYDPSEQAWAVGPPRNATGLTSWSEAQPDVAQAQAIDATDQAYPIQPPAVVGFDPAAGFPWAVEDGQQLRSLAETRYDGQDGALGEPPLNVDRLAAFTDPQADPAPPLTADPTDQPWAIGPPQNADRLTVWSEAQPDVAAGQTLDPTDQPYAIQPPATAFDPAAGFPWTSDDRQQVADLVERRYDGQDGSLVQAFDPSSSFPWLADSQQDRSLQPVWTDGQHGSPAYTPPTDPGVLGGVWNLDAQQDRSTAPVWWDPTDQAYAIGPTLTAAQLGTLWRGADPQQDRSLQPVWYEPELGNVWTAGAGVVTAVIGGRGPDSGSAYNAIPGGQAFAPIPGGSASHPLPGGTATNPRPER